MRLRACPGMTMVAARTAPHPCASGQTDMTQSEKSRLDDIGILALVGAGKMGGAMLEGWLALGLDPRNVVVIDPKPSEDVVALSRKGIALNPAAGANRT